ncbi:phosphopentomutase [Salibacterium salarium]|uniref:Phosphopentomutase n=1 Tax=Salibacterium salarium TaxID=284579 RepID=A0A428MZC8_9BACI|nr:phosphopentomutase [Salibacterium salarium]RSL31514.1 phosphopentomutase [Salibacterium salarium]
MKRRAILLIIDSLGIGSMEDAKTTRPADVGANTFYHIADRAEAFSIPAFEKLGINQLLHHPGLENPVPAASTGALLLKHEGADSFAGHNEIMGTKPKTPYSAPFATVINEVQSYMWEQGYKAEIPDEDFPYLLINDVVVAADNIETDYGQIYNVSAPLDLIPFEEVLKIGETIRHCVKVNRVIALGGENVSRSQLLQSIEKREDGLVGVNSPASGLYEQGYQVRHLGYGITPDTQAATIVGKSGLDVTLIGKMQDVISCEGAKKIPGIDTAFVMESIVQEMDEMEEGFMAATVQETDLAGHAENIERYAEKIQLVDRYLDTIIEKMKPQDLLLISADHGNDPTIGHSQHTREKTFVLVYGKEQQAQALNERETLSDLGATVTDYLGLANTENGTSLLGEQESHA